jgi:hypothetical protein
VGAHRLRLIGKRIEHNFGPLERLTLTDTDGYEQYEVSLGPHLGWAVDWSAGGEAGSFGRMNLRQALFGTAEPPPTVRLDEAAVGDVAAVLASALGLRTETNGLRPLRRCAPTPRSHGYSEVVAERDKHYEVSYNAEVCAAWLRWAGYTDTTVEYAQGKRPAVASGSLSIFLSGGRARLSLSQVRQAQGQASVDGKPALVVSHNGFSRHARAWADVAGVALMDLQQGGPLAAASAVASEMMPNAQGHVLRSCEDDTCQRIGCVLDASDCPDDQGPPWTSPRFEQWYVTT